MTDGGMDWWMDEFMNKWMGEWLDAGMASLIQRLRDNYLSIPNSCTCEHMSVFNILGTCKPRCLVHIYMNTLF